MTKQPLYRSTANVRIAGVCAGIADYFGIETWLVRILTVTAFFLMAGPFVMVAYIAAWFIMDKRPEHEPLVDTHNVVDMERTGNTGKGWYNGPRESRIEIKQKVWQAGQPPRQAFNQVKALFEDNERRIRKVEHYVTSPAFKLDSEISKL